MGAQGRIKGGYSVHTPYIVLVSVIVTITLGLKLIKKNESKNRTFGFKNLKKTPKK